ncbi:hypothetical protein Y032_0203g1842 [Ancylostoma ceylanicum]|uniref:Arrestin C-terminal-like domain-containing protein n=1 Tax=Ancylostoma ceylanicum TaxID=53326 RepID=A0A016SM55_9BILA|nr:hypothetical protein Y032_0203g1842 [Ancylostoma ceylanicum]
MSVSIEIADASRSFTPGERVQGYVKVSADQPLKAKSLRVFLKAGAETEWLVSVYGIDSVHGRSAKVMYAAGVTYAQEEHCLWSPEENEKKGTIPSGIHSFPFAFSLPMNCPPSFEGTCGSITYTITAEIERPWKVNKTCAVTLSVCPVFDLNLIPEAILSASAFKFKKTGCMLFRHGKICVQMRLERSGFAVGETLEAVAEINNNTKQPVVKVDLRLRRVDSYTAYRHGKTSNNNVKRCNKRQEETTVAESSENIDIAPHEVETTSVSLKIPETSPTFKTCSIIEVTYYVEVRVVCKGTINNSVSCRCPVIIGTLPLAANAVDESAT